MSRYNKSERDRVLKFLEQERPGVSAEILKEFSVLWAGWEMDDVAWVVDVGGKVSLVVANHGALALLTGPLALSFLNGKIMDYNDAVKESQTALKLLLMGE